MAEHFYANAQEIIKRTAEVSEPFVVELGCNDGIMLKHIASKGIKPLGIEPSGNVAAECRIEFISSQVDNSTQSILAKAIVKNGSGALRTSQFARARIVWGVHTCPVIPVLAVSRINGQFFVFVVQGSGKSLVARQRMLRLGELKDNQYPVLDGLKTGDRLVVDGAQNLLDGAPVTEVSGAPGGKPSS